MRKLDVEARGAHGEAFQRRPSSLSQPASQSVGTKQTYFTVIKEHIERKNADFDLDVLNLDIFALTGHELLKRHDLLVDHVPRYRLAVEHEALGFTLDPSVELSKNIRIFFREILGIS